MTLGDRSQHEDDRILLSQCDKIVPKQLQESRFESMHSMLHSHRISSNKQGLGFDSNEVLESTAICMLLRSRWEVPSATQMQELCMLTGNVTRQAYTVEEFCESHRISRAMFYILQSQGKGPRIMKVGRRTLISEEAAKEWRARMES